LGLKKRKRAKGRVSLGTNGKNVEGHIGRTAEVEKMSGGGRGDQCERVGGDGTLCKCETERWGGGGTKFSLQRGGVVQIYLELGRTESAEGGGDKKNRRDLLCKPKKGRVWWVKELGVD